MIFSVQNNNRMSSVEFSADLEQIQIQVRETVCGVFLAQMDIPIQVWLMVAVMRINKLQITQVTPTENQLGKMQMMEEVAEHVEMNYPDTPNSRYVAHTFDDFLFPWE